jgi:hypothetical protein
VSANPKENIKIKILIFVANTKLANLELQLPGEIKC